MRCNPCNLTTDLLPLQLQDHLFKISFSACDSNILLLLLLLLRPFPPHLTEPNKRILQATPKAQPEGVVVFLVLRASTRSSCPENWDDLRLDSWCFYMFLCSISVKKSTEIQVPVFSCLSLPSLKYLGSPNYNANTMDQSTEAPHWMQKKRTLHSQFLQRLRPKGLKLWQKFSFQHSETASILEFEKCCVSPWLLLSCGSFRAKNLGYQPVDCQYLPPLGESESQEFPGQYDKDAYEGHRVACYCSCCGKNHCETIGYHEAFLNTNGISVRIPHPSPNQKKKQVGHDSTLVFTPPMLQCVPAMLQLYRWQCPLENWADEDQIHL